MTRDLETRARLLKAAEQLFADRGFKKVTVRDICRVARANVAAVNYHFGDKLGLYREVMQSVIDRIRATNEAAREAGQGRSPEERLRRSIVIFVTRLLTSSSETVHRLIHREITDPTPALDALVEQAIRPRVDYLSSLIAEILGCSPTDARVRRSVSSIQVQSIAYIPHPIPTRVGLTTRPTTRRQIETIAHHIAEFSVGGTLRIARLKHPQRFRR